MNCIKCGVEVRDWWMGLCAKCTSLAASDTIRGLNVEVDRLNGELAVKSITNDQLIKECQRVDAKLTDAYLRGQNDMRGRAAQVADNCHQGVSTCGDVIAALTIMEEPAT
jgi:hypothetical protein